MCRSCWKRWKNNGIVGKPVRFGYPFCKWGNALTPRGECAVPTAGGVRRTRGVGSAPYPRRGAKRKGHLRFPFLFELLPFPLLHSLAKIGERRPLRNKGYGRGFFLCYGRTTFGVRPLEQPVRSARYHTATHIGGSQQAQHKVNCPKGKRGSPGGYPCCATLWHVITHGTCGYNLLHNILCRAGHPRVASLALAGNSPSDLTPPHLN